MASVSARLSRPAYDDLGEDQHLAPIFPPGMRPTLDDWRAMRAELMARWQALLGEPACERPDGAAEAVDGFETGYCHATVYRQPTGPTSRQLIFLLEPTATPHSPRPVAVVPFYHPDPMAGYDLATRERRADRPLVQFGRHLAEQGYVVACVEAFPFNTVPEPEPNEGFAWWQAAAEKVLADNPGWTGMGKLVWDTRLATDLVLAQPDTDPARTVIIGHSLGGKMAFYNACLDGRIKAVIACDFGIGYGFTNWEAPWYLGHKAADTSHGLFHHHLLALLAPRSLLVIAGHYDRPASWQYVNAAREVYRLYGREEVLGIFDHATGHQPTEDSIRSAYTWLAEQLELPPVPCDL